MIRRPVGRHTGRRNGPRAPLFGVVRRCLEAARLSVRSGVAPAELLERGAASTCDRCSEVPRPQVGLSRRRFVGSSLTLAAGLALQGCAFRPVRSLGEAPVVVVGAGIAGLTAAYRLQQAGVAVRLLEAQQRVGGRMFSLRDRFAEGQVAELGGELIDTGHVHLRALAEELGIPLLDLDDEDPALDREVWYFDGERRTSVEVVEAFRPLAARIDKDLAGLTGDGWVAYDDPQGGEDLDRLSIAEWLDRAGADGWFRRLIEVAYTTEFGLEPGEQSALNLLLMIDPEPDPFHIFGDSDERFRVDGGNDRIPSELARRLDSAIELGVRLEAIREAADGTLRAAVQGTGRGDGGAREIAASHIVLTLPFTLLREVELDLDLSPVKRRAIEELGYGTNAKLMAGFSRRVWRTEHGSDGTVVADLRFQSCWETSRQQAGEAGILTNFTGGDHGLSLGAGRAAEQAERFAAELEAVFPGAVAAREGMTEARFHWPSFPWTRGSYACYRVGQWTAFAGAEGERVGNVHFAGEHCSLEAQGFMEGGCETGESAARSILADMGLEAPVAARSVVATRRLVTPREWTR